jgi:uncharacterized protein (TIGR00295 family)
MECCYSKITELNEGEIADTLLKYLKDKGVQEEVLNHILKVVESSKKIMDKLNLSETQRKLILAGAFLHDIGRIKSHGMDHAVLGAEILREDGFDERIVRIVERHIGAGLTAEEAKVFDLPEKDYIPETVEEKVVALADNLVAGNRIMGKDEYITEIRKKFSEQPEVLKRHLALLKEFEDVLD